METPQIRADGGGQLRRRGRDALRGRCRGEWWLTSTVVNGPFAMPLAVDSCALWWFRVSEVG